MSQELSAELLDIENKIGKLETKIEDIEERMYKKQDAYHAIEKRFFESYESYEERQRKAQDEEISYRLHWQPEINNWRKQIKDLEERKKQINEQLYAGMDESEDF